MDDSFTCSFRKREAYDRMIDLHSHDGLCELYFLSSGERRYFIQDTVMSVHAKGFVFIKPSLMHKTSYLGSGSHTRYYANVPSAWLDDLLPFLPPFFVVERQEELEVLFSQLLKEYSEPDDLSPIRIRSLCTEILVRAYRAYSQSLKSGDEFISRVASFIRTNIRGDVSLEAVSGHMGFSPCYFSSLFHRKAGLRLSDFIRSTRVAVAAQALECGMSVREASELAGFSEPGYFKDVFRSVMKISPSAYKKSRAKKAEDLPFRI